MLDPTNGKWRRERVQLDVMDYGFLSPVNRALNSVSKLANVFPGQAIVPKHLERTRRECRVVGSPISEAIWAAKFAANRGRLQAAPDQLISEVASSVRVPSGPR